MNNSNILPNMKKNPKWAIGVMAVCVLSGVINTLMPPNPVTDYVSLPFGAVSTTYCCACLMLILGVNVSMPVTKDNIAAAIVVCCVAGCIAASLQMAGKIKEGEETS